MTISWYEMIEWKQITLGYSRYMEFDIAFVFYVKALLDIRKLSNFHIIDAVPLKTKIICFWFQTMENDWVWRKVFDKFITILNLSVNIKVFFFQLVSIFEKPDCKFESFFTEELKILNNNLIPYMHLCVVNCSLHYVKRVVT